MLLKAIECRHLPASSYESVAVIFRSHHVHAMSLQEYSAGCNSNQPINGNDFLFSFKRALIRYLIGYG